MYAIRSYYGCRLGASVAAETGGRIESAVNAVARQIIPPVRHTAIGFGLVLDRRFELDPRSMAVIAEAGLVTHGAELFVLIRLHAVGSYNFV